MCTIYKMRSALLDIKHEVKAGCFGSDKACTVSFANIKYLAGTISLPTLGCGVYKLTQSTLESTLTNSIQSFLLSLLSFSHVISYVSISSF